MGFFNPEILFARCYLPGFDKKSDDERFVCSMAVAF